MSVEWDKQNVEPRPMAHKASAVVEGFRVEVSVSPEGYMEGRVPGILDGVLVLAYMPFAKGTLEIAMAWAEATVPVLFAHGWQPRLPR